MDLGLSAMARGPEAQSLVRFASRLPSTWLDSQVTAMISGNVLNNVNGATLDDRDGDANLNPEYLVHLTANGSSIVVNLATVLALAAAYCRDQQGLAREIMATARENHGTARKGRNKRKVK